MQNFKKVILYENETIKFHNSRISLVKTFSTTPYYKNTCYKDDEGKKKEVEGSDFGKEGDGIGIGEGTYKLRVGLESEHRKKVRQSYGLKIMQIV